MKRSAGEIGKALEDLAARGELRVRRCVERVSDGVLAPVVEGRRLLNFCSNDYLGLAGDPRVAEAMAQAARRWGAGAGAAHLVTGHGYEHHALEEELADFTGRERALLFSTGYMANAGVIGAFAARGEAVLEDRLNHASLLDGALQCGARLLRYRHRDAADAARIAAEHERNLALIVTDGVFSMDGDVAPLAQLAEVARRHSAWLMVDDAHGLGVLGRNGRGSLEQAALDAAQVPLLVGTLGKAFGSFGAFVAGDRDVVEYVMQRARTYLFTTALPPAVAAAARAALAIAREEGWRRTEVAARVARFRAGAARLDLPLMDSSTPIQPVLVPGAAACIAASEALRERGFWVSAIRHPTVPKGGERLRVTLSAAHGPEQVDALLEALAEVLRAISSTAAEQQGSAA
jgi:8-amino-7-oxononanoate synthase